MRGELSLRVDPLRLTLEFGPTAVVRTAHRLAPLELAAVLLLPVSAALLFPRNTQHVRSAAQVFSIWPDRRHVLGGHVSLRASAASCAHPSAP